MHIVRVLLILLAWRPRQQTVSSKPLRRKAADLEMDAPQLKRPPHIFKTDIQESLQWRMENSAGKRQAREEVLFVHKPTPAPTYYTAKHKTSKRCSDDFDCMRVLGQVCNIEKQGSTGTCQCPDSTPVHVVEHDQPRCVSARLIFEDCADTAECAFLNPYVECVNQICTCSPPNVMKRKDLCIPASASNTTSPAANVFAILLMSIGAIGGIVALVASFNATFRSTSTPPGFPVPFTPRPSTEFWTPGPHSPLLTSTPLRGHLDGRGQWPACGMDVTVPLEQPAPAAAGRRPVTDSCPVQGSHTNRQAPLGPPPTSDRRGEADSLSAMLSTRGAHGDPPQRRPAPSPPRSNPHSVRRCHRHHYITSPSSRTAGGVRTCQAAHNTTGSSGTRRRHSRHHRRSDGPLRGEECGRAPRSFLHKPLDGASASVSTLASDKRGVASKIKGRVRQGKGAFSGRCLPWRGTRCGREGE
ncbi:uncharacterized protein LOC135394858 [Ornithodoros turicata]|uniref:uncharacterized protein LOC135376642 n=1 Tax=Ornithodoros turicata TaxID=34597 RepID=UPI003138758E